MRYAVLTAAVTLSLLASASHGPAAAATVPAPAAQSNSSSTIGPSLSQRPVGVGAFVALPLRNHAELESLVNQQSTPHSPLYHRFLSPQQFRAAYGPLPDTLAAVEGTLRAQGFATERTSTGVYVSAPQATFERAFSVKLAHTLNTAARLTPDRPLALPQTLISAGANIVGFTASRGFRPQSHIAGRKAVPDNRYGPIGPYWFTDLKQAYEYPSEKVAFGLGRTIGIVGFQDFLSSDIKAYFAHEKIAAPQITRRLVSGGPAPADPLNSGLTQELQLDIVEAGGSVPHAKLITYLGPTPDPSSPGIEDATFIGPFIAAVEDNNVDVLTTSFGGCETDSTVGILQAFHDIFLQGNAQGISFIFSSGDNGALECVANGKAALGVSAFADDPNVTGVGGSIRLQTTPSTTARPRRSEYVSESSFAQTFNASFAGEAPGSIWGSGGGISKVWAKPSYQTLVNTRSNARTVPDVSLHMGGFTCDDPSFPIVLPTPGCIDGSSTLVPLAIGTKDGGYFGFVGTSASAPEFAGLLALQEQIFGGAREGNANNIIYALAATPGLNVYHTNVPGNNGYPATPGYNYVLGNGTVRGAAFTLRGNGPLAGDPWTSSNP